MVFNNITTPTETEKEERSTTQSEKIDNGEMSFEAVPCMFKSRQENGAEESLFGLLIRPVIASNNNITELNNNTIITNNEQLRDDNNKNILMASTSADNKKQSSLLSSPSNSIPLSSCSNSIRSSSSVIFASKMLHSHQNVKQLPSTTSLHFLPAPSGVPPILPRPKQQQKRLKNVLLKAPKVIPIQPKIATTTSSTFTSSFHPLQVLSPTTITSNQQISHNNTNLNTSLASCSNNILEGQISGLLTIHSPTSPKLATIKKCQKQKITPIKENKRKEEEEEEKSSSKQQATPNKLKKYQKRNKEIKKQNKRQIGRTNSEVMLGEDLHEIDLSQLVNSTVITTEDYLPSQLSEPTIYTNLDMYNTPNNACIDLHQQSISSNNNICQNTTTTIPLNQQKGLNFVEHSINNTNNQSLSPIISSELTNLQRPLLSSSSVPSSSTSILCQYNNDQQQQNISTVSVIAPICSNSQPVWHPYLVTHPGISHISSTPDSGIQSIDGSPPSVYTPPMVSPYSSQVRSCESVSATSHGISIGLGPSTSSTISSFPISFNQNNNFESFLQLNNFQLTNSHLPPQLIGQQKVNEDKHFDILPEQEEEEEERRNENEGLFSDFSDMPKLIPITLSQHDESLDGEDNKEIKKLNDNIFENNNEEKEEEKEEIKKSSNSLTSSTKELINIHKGMTLQELAECISSSIPPEQLKQLTSLIQLKAVNSKEVEIVEKGSSTKLKKDKKELEVEGSNDKTINKNIISNKFDTKKKFKENMISQISNEQQQQQPSTSSTFTSSIKLNENNINKTTLKGKEKVNYLSIYRYQVRLQLKQKLDLFIDKVCNQLENTHLNIQRQQQFWKSSHPLQKLDWELINKRLLEKKKEGKEELLFKNETKKHRKRRRIKENYEEKGEREEINKKKKHCNILLL